MRFVTQGRKSLVLGNRDGREPVDCTKFDAQRRRAYRFPFGQVYVQDLKRLFLLFYGLAPVTVTCRHFVV